FSSFSPGSGGPSPRSQTPVSKRPGTRLPFWQVLQGIVIADNCSPQSRKSRIPNILPPRIPGRFETPVWERLPAKLCFAAGQGTGPLAAWETEFPGHPFPNGSLGTRGHGGREDQEREPIHHSPVAARIRWRTTDVTPLGTELDSGGGDLR